MNIKKKKKKKKGPKILLGSDAYIYHRLAWQASPRQKDAPAALEAGVERTVGKSPAETNCDGLMDYRGTDGYHCDGLMDYRGTDGYPIWFDRRPCPLSKP